MAKAPTPPPAPDEQSTAASFREFPEEPVGTSAVWPLDARGAKTLVAGGLLLALFIAAAAVMWSVNHTKPPATTPKEADEKATAALAAERIRAAEAAATAKAAADRREQDALARGQLMAARDRITAVSRTLDEFDGELAAWESTVVPLLQNDRGRALASQVERVRLFAALFERPRGNRQDGVAVRERLAALLDPIQQALAGAAAAYVPGDALLAQIDREQSGARALVDAFRQSRTGIEALLGQMPTATPGGELTLAQSLDAMRTEHAGERNRLLAQQTDEARKRGDEALAAAEADRKRQQDEDAVRALQARQEAERLAAEAETARVKLEAEQKAQRERDQREHDRRVALARTDDVRATLRPFITLGMWQPARLTAPPEKRPMSLNAIRSKQALRPDDTGYRMLVALANDKNNDRPHWSIVYAQSKTFAKATDEQRDEVVRAQKYLNDLGPILVELGMLSE